ncbi:hypothetical protein F442_02097 [Phytophthora nicotianae P10297]|uniref:RxLR effector protein n=1 Tax=Phytophthora nicotianae P10297 TaxID=1317064 RepID=W3A359_PHYNI|nr:hypothetical protein F442_02097 [Phytophthora nicotianae P10297]
MKVILILAVMVIAIVSAKTPQSPSKPLLTGQRCDDNLQVQDESGVDSVIEHVASVVESPTPVTNTIHSALPDAPTVQVEVLRRRRTS